MRIVEFNGGETILGPATTGLLARYWRGSPAVGELIDRWQAPESMSENDTWLVDELLELASARGMSDDDTGRIAVLAPAGAHGFVEFDLHQAAGPARRSHRFHCRTRAVRRTSRCRGLGVLVYPTSSVLANLHNWSEGVPAGALG